MPICKSCSPRVVLGLVALLSGCHAGGETAAGDPPKALSVQVARAARRDIAQELELAGLLDALPGQDVKLGALAPGRLAQVLVAEGDRVRKGRVLARLDATALHDSVSQAEAQLAQANAQVANSSARLERAQQAFTAGVAAGQEVDDARLQDASARAQLRTAQAQLSTARSQLRHGELRAPFDGVVVKLFAAPGEPVDPSRPIVEVAKVAILELHASAAPAAATRLHKGQVATLEVDGQPGVRVPATVTALSPALDPATGVLLVRLRVPNPGELLKLNSSARAHVTLELHHNALVVPRQALLSSASEQSVERVEGGLARRVAVQPGFQDAEGSEILAGLNEGDSVIVQGAYAIPDGTPIATPPALGQEPAHVDTDGATQPEGVRPGSAR